MFALSRIVSSPLPGCVLAHPAGQVPPHLFPRSALVPRRRARHGDAQARLPRATATGSGARAGKPKKPRLDWAALHAKVWAVDVWQCPCGGRRKVTAIVTSRSVAEEILRNQRPTAAFLTPLRGARSGAAPARAVAALALTSVPSTRPRRHPQLRQVATFRVANGLLPMQRHASPGLAAHRAALAPVRFGGSNFLDVHHNARGFSSAVVYQS